MKINHPPVVLPSNQSMLSVAKLAVKSEPYIRQSTWGGDVKPPPLMQNPEIYEHLVTGMSAAHTADLTQASQVSIKV
ncbi:hypothetical protein HQQ94_10200 [Shewanella sp. VB17]|uniref:hypothetical protein n=1 Tax=Shewanella sp. VB17 TaxID=2739432 RepID=UPI0015650BA2|nr:hypothetical protein [Shewanella sp. VB17]NRD73614.1 hypothetical protein [Shewanella sp. VB17]